MAYSLKTAAQDESRAELEAAVASIARDKISKSLPRLQQYELGFEIIDTNDNGTYAFGVTAIAVGKHILLAPIVYRNGEAMGGEMLYSKTRDFVFPRKETWVDEVLASELRPHGVEVDAKTVRRFATEPIMGVGSGSGRSFTISKFAAALEPSRETKIAAKQAAREWGQKIAFSPEFPQDSDTLSLFAGTVPQKVASELIRYVMADPSLLKAASALYSSETDTIKALAQLGDPRKQEVSLKATTSTETNGEPATDIGGVTVLSAKDRATLSPEQALEVAERGFSIDDTRDPTKLAVLGANTDRNFETPSQTGYWDVLLGDGSVKTMFIVTNRAAGLAGAGRPSNDAIVIDDDKYEQRSLQSIYVVPNSYNPTRTTRFISRLSKTRPSDKHAIENYLVCTRNAHFAGPFSFDENNRMLCFEPDMLEYNIVDVPEGAQFAAETDYERGSRRKEVRIPKDARYLQLGQMSSLSLGNPFRHGRVLKVKDVGFDIAKKASDQWRVAGHNVSGPAAVSQTMVRYGLSQQDALAVLDKPHAYVIAKKASLIPDEALESIMAPEYGYTPRLERGLTVTVSPAHSGRAVGYQSSTIPDHDPDPWGEPRISFDSARTGVLRAALTGRRDVFGVGALQSIINFASPEQLIDRRVPALLRGLDALGRLLLSAYVHPGMYEDKYGRQAAPNLTDAIRASFEQLGDVLVALRQHVNAFGPSGVTSQFEHINDE